MTEAEAAIAQVKRVHRPRPGHRPRRPPYSADDPELVTFIHVAEVASFLASSQRYGTGPLSPEECDRYYEEVAPVALALGATWAPRSAAEVESYLLRAASRALRRTTGEGGAGIGCSAAWRGGRASGPSTRSCWPPAVGVLPGWARRELGLSVAGPLDLLIDTAAVAPLTRGLSPPCAGW